MAAFCQIEAERRFAVGGDGLPTPIIAVGTPAACFCKYQGTKGFVRQETIDEQRTEGGRSADTVFDLQFVGAVRWHIECIFQPMAKPIPMEERLAVGSDFVRNGNGTVAFRCRIFRLDNDFRAFGG